MPVLIHHVPCFFIKPCGRNYCNGGKGPGDLRFPVNIMRWGSVVDVASFYRGVTTAPGVAASVAVDAVGTDLTPGSQSVAAVTPGDTGNSTRNSTEGQGGASQQPPEQTQRVTRFTRDSATNTLVFMEVNPKSDTVISQFPEEQVLKLKSYLAEVQRHEEAERKSMPGQMVAKVT